MRRLLTCTTALSVALAQPYPLLAQQVTGDGRVVASDGSVLCEPTADAACNPDDFVAQAQAIDQAIAAAAQAEADAAAAAQAEADAAAAAQAEADAAAAAQAEADAAAAAQAEADAAAAAQAEADAAAAAQAEADAAAAAQAEADAAAAAQAEADAAAAAQAEADAAAAAQAEADAAAAAQAEADAAAAAEAAGQDAAKAAEDAAAADAAKAAEDAAAADAAKATDDAAAADAAKAAEDAAAADAAKAADDAAAADAAKAAEDAAAADAAKAAEDAAAAVVEAPVELTEEELAAKAAADAAALAAAEAELKVDAEGVFVDPAAGLKTAEPEEDATVEPVDAPVVSETEQESLNTLLVEPAATDPVAPEAAVALPLVEGQLPADQAPSAEAVTAVTEVLTEDSQRSSTQEFAAAPVALEDGRKRNRLSNLEKVGLVVLGALVVGAIIKDVNKREDRRVVSNTGDRVVVLKPDGTYQVYKDDDTVIRRPGSKVRTETYRDGSTRTIVERPDGSQVVTIRDATGRVLRRAQYDRLGRELVLFDDLEPEEVVIIRDLPKPRKSRVVISTLDDDAELKLALAAQDVAKAGRKFSLRQIREIPEVRALAATIDVDAITFDSGSSAIRASEANDLADLGSLMQDILDDNPREMFLIEGHTDATGAAALNLALSDRRAESVALALTEYFDIPPENMVIQGYGETELRIDTLANEKRNRRVAVRIIGPLLRQAK